MLLVLCGQQTVNASVTVAAGDVVTFAMDPASFQDGGVSGGEFLGTDLNPNNSGTFTTFCASVQTHMDLNTQYTVTSLATPAFDKSTAIGLEASYVFDLYNANASLLTPPSNLSGFVPGTTLLNGSQNLGTATNPLSGNEVAGAMQYLFWQALGGQTPPTDAWYNAYEAVEQVYDWSDYVTNPLNNINENTVNTVYVMQLDNGADQPQLWFSTTGNPGGTTTPEPVSLVVWSVLGAGAAGCLAVRRRRAGRWSAENRQAIMGIIETKVAR